MKKFRAVLALVLALLMVLLVGCSQSDKKASTSTSDDKSEKASINFLTWRGDDKPAYDQVVANFNKEYPNISVNFEYAVNNYSQVLNTRLLSNDVDLFALDGRLGPYVSGGHLLDLTKYSSKYDNFLNNYQDAALKPCTFDGKVYGACQMECMVCTFYNVDMFKKYGFDGPPKTWDEFINVCDTFMKNGIKPLACGNSTTLSRQLAYQLICSMDPKNSSNIFANIYDGKSTFNDEPVSTVSKCVQQVAKAGYYCDGSTGLDKFGATTVFMNGQSPMLIEGSWRAVTLVQNKTLNWDVFSICGPGGTYGDYLFRPGQVHVVNAKTENLSAALKYFAFMSQPESMKIFSATTVQVPVGKDIKIDNPALNKVVAYMNKYKQSGDPEQNMQTNEVADLCGQYFMSITLGTPIDTAIKNTMQSFKNMKG